MIDIELNQEIHATDQRHIKRNRSSWRLAHSWYSWLVPEIIKKDVEFMEGEIDRLRKLKGKTP